MAFSATYKFYIGDDAGKNRFLLEHYIEHRRFIDALLAQTPSFSAVDLPIQTMEDPKRWLAAHQQMSQSAWTGAGGGQSTDFGTLNWQNNADVEDWFVAHKAWHDSLRTSLGL